VLGHVGERLRAEEVHARLDRGREPARGYLDLDRNRRPDGQGADGGGQAALGEDRGQDPGRELAQVVEAVPGVGQGQADQFPRALRRRLPLLLGQLEVDQGGDEPLLRPVVQVAGHPLAGRDRGGHLPGARRHQLPLGVTSFGDIADVAGEGRVLGRPGPGHRDLGREHAPVGSHRRQLEPLIQDAPLPGGQVAGEAEPVRLAQRRRHDHVRQLAAGHLDGPVAEDLLERGVDVRHQTPAVDADDGVEGGLQDGVLAGLARGQLRGPVRDQLEPGDGGAARLREHREQEPLLGRQRLTAQDDQEDRLGRQRRHQREGPARGETGQLERAGFGARGQQAGRLGRGALVVVAGQVRMPGLPGVAGRDRRDRGGDQPHDLARGRRLGQDQRQAEDRVDRDEVRVDGPGGPAGPLR
jgi:hypothetical protein